MTLVEATACIAREMNRQGATTVIPTEGGNDIDFKASSGFFGGTVDEPWTTFKLRQESGATKLKIFYRHPVNQRSINKDIKNLQKRCLAVLQINPG